MAGFRSRLVLAALALLPAAPAAAQSQAAAATPEPSPIAAYRREVFTYQRGGRPDPFQPLLSAADLGYRVEDLRLTSIIYSPNPGQSVAVFALADSANRRFRLRAGQRLGTITVAAIYPRRVDLRLEDFGVARIESVTLQRPGPQGTGPAPAATQGGTPNAQGPGVVPFVVRQTAPAQPPPGALRRGGARNAQPQNTTTPAQNAPRPGGPSSGTSYR